MGRNTHGVRGIKVSEADEVVGLVVADPDGFLLTVCENGYGKRTPFGPNTAADASDGEEPTTETETEPETEAEASATEPPLEPEPEAETSATEAPPADGDEPQDRSGMRYRRQRRGGKGVRDIRTSERNGPVVGVASVRAGDDVMLITTQGMVNRTHADEIRVTGRNAQGVRVMNLNEGDGLASIAKIATEAEEEAAPPAPEAGTPS
jgi:DNA gyrase subunit A